MLEAFQASAKESAERAAAERRRIVAEREREIRKDEAARTAQELGQRLGAGAISSWISGLRTTNDEVDTSKETSTVGMEAPPSPPPPPPQSGPPSEPVQPAGPDEPITDSIDTNRPPTDSIPVGSILGPTALAAVSETLATPEPMESTESSAPSPPSSLLDDATAEELDEAISAIDGEMFALPMSGRAFGWLFGATLVAVFLIGLGAGRRSEGGATHAGERSASNGSNGSNGSGALGRAPFDVPPRVLAGTPGSRAAGTPANHESSRVLGGTPAYVTGSGGLDGEGAEDPSTGPDAADSAPGPGLSVADRAFLDPKMEYTIMAITYASTEVNRGLAVETYALLDREGFPVIQPVDDGRRIYLFVGAAATKTQLAELRDDLSSLRSGRSGRNEFRSAYVVNIDSYR